MENDGIFKTKTCGFVGKQQATREWLTAAYERAERLEKALKPKKQSKQLRLRWGK